MESIHIKKFEARYHLPPFLFSRRERLDRLLQDVLDEGLEQALERIGISPRDEICIRQIYMPVRLRTSLPDHALVMDWSLALAEYLHAVITGNDQKNVIRYSSRLHGLIDFATGIALGDYNRAWAWRELGFIRGSHSDSGDGLPVEFMRALLYEPIWIIPVLKTLAEADQLHRLAGRLEEQWWEALALEALSACGFDPASITITGSPDHTETLFIDDALDRIISRIVATSSIAQALRNHPQLLNKSVISPLPYAALAILEAEPEQLRRAYHEPLTLLQRTARALQAFADTGGPMIAERMRVKPVKGVEESHPPAMKRPKPLDSAREGDDIATYPSRIKKDRLVSSDRIDDADWKESNGAKAKGDHPEPFLNAFDLSDWHESGKTEGDAHRDGKAFLHDRPRIEEKSQDIAAEETYILPDIRQEGYTEIGGLIFLLPLLEHIGIIEAIHANPLFKKRPMRWILHRLALCLVPVDERDPGVLAFCGLRPEDALPWMDEAEPSPEENEMIAEWIDRIVDALRLRLGWEETSGEKIVQTVCRRRARIVADPGWIEVVFSMEDISTDIRRAALDLDPGYLPWLGVVIKFIYE